MISLLIDENERTDELLCSASIPAATHLVCVPLIIFQLNYIYNRQMAETNHN